MAKEKREVTVLQMTEAPENLGMKEVKEFTPEHAKAILADQKVSGHVFWEKAPESAKITQKLVVLDADEVTALPFVEQVALETEAGKNAQ